MSSRSDEWHHVCDFGKRGNTSGQSCEYWDPRVQGGAGIVGVGTGNYESETKRSSYRRTVSYCIGSSHRYMQRGDK